MGEIRQRFSKESNKVWKESQSDPPMIANQDFRTAKIMYCIFFDRRGPVAQILVPKGRTVTGNFYAAIVSLKLNIT